MDRRLPKDKVERRVFAAFVKVCPLRLRVDAIESRKPPEPDILCITEDGERVAFEIARCDDEKGSQSISRGSSLGHAFAKFLTTYPRREKFLRHVQGRTISPFYRDGITGRQMKENFSLLCEFLLQSDVSRATLDPFSPIPNLQLQGIVHDIDLGESSDGEPVLEYFTASWAAPAEVAISRAISKKREKKYSTSHPIELLVWFGISPEIIRDETWGVLESEVPQIVEHSPFRRIWVYSWGSEKILWVFPDVPPWDRSMVGKLVNSDSA